MDHGSPTSRALLARAGLDGTPLEHDPFNFVDRKGTWWLTYSTALHASQAFAAAEPEMVDIYLRYWEDRFKADGWRPGNRHAHDNLREWSPHLALARSWTRPPQGHAAEKEVQRLQALVGEWAAVRLLRQRGLEQEGDRIEGFEVGRDREAAP